MAESVNILSAQSNENASLKNGALATASNSTKQQHTPPSGDTPEPPFKRPKMETPQNDDHPPRQKGVAQIKPEFLVTPRGSKALEAGSKTTVEIASPERQPDTRAQSQDGKGKRQKLKGQNVNRNFGSSKDAIQLCMSRARAPEFSPEPCPFQDSCKYEHDLRRYLEDGKREDLKTLGGKCPAWEARGFCSAGWRCRFATSHSTERVLEDGTKELVLLDNGTQKNAPGGLGNVSENNLDILNVVSAQEKIALQKRKLQTPKADAFMKSLSNEDGNEHEDKNSHSKHEKHSHDQVHENRARYVDTPLLPSEKRRLHYGPETPVLAPLTTQGNLPFRRLCVELGAQVTWSEMAMGLPLLQGEKTDWTLMRAHESELSPPKCTSPVVQGYDNSKDLKFGAQIAANKPWLATKATEVLTALCPHLRAVDLNCGCPIDMIFRQGAGSALLDNPGRLEKIVRGMNAVSNDVPITIKIRMGTKDDKPTAERLIERLAFGIVENSQSKEGAAGAAAITLHGRSRQQRYTRSADWEYISSCAALIKGYKEEQDARLDTISEPDPRRLSSVKDGKVFFVGNGDCYSHVDYFKHIEDAKVDSVMIARGALIKPWIFEEIETGQYLDKSSRERLDYIERFVKYGLQSWGSDEIGVGMTRRFLLEWLSFSCRYVPIGMLEHLPPNIQDRPPAYRGRDDLETLLSSENYRDWIKISEMFLGPAHKDFRFEPKHKSHMAADAAEG